MAFSGECREIVRPDRLVFIQRYEPVRQRPRRHPDLSGTRRHHHADGGRCCTPRRRTVTATSSQVWKTASRTRLAQLEEVARSLAASSMARSASLAREAQLRDCDQPGSSAPIRAPRIRTLDRGRPEAHTVVVSLDLRFAGARGLADFRSPRAMSP